MSELVGQERRLECLERQARWAKRIVFVGFIAVTVVLLTAQSPAKRVVQASEFQLVDDGGNVRAKLFFQQGEPALVLFDSKGRFRTGVEVSRNGSGLVVTDPEHGNAQSGLLQTEQGPAIILNASPTGPGMTLQVLQNKPSITITDAQDKKRFQIGDLREGFGLRLFDDTERVIGTLGETRIGPVLALHSRGKSQASLIASTQGPFLMMLDEDGKQLLLLPPHQ
jgi:hypothetical protein